MYYVKLCAMMKNISVEFYNEKVFNELFNPEHLFLYCCITTVNWLLI